MIFLVVKTNTGIKLKMHLKYLVKPNCSNTNINEQAFEQLIKNSQVNSGFPQRSDLPRERMCSWAVMAEKVAAGASQAVLQESLNLFLFLYLKYSKLPLNLLCYTAVPVFFQKWPKPAQLNILSLGVTTISMVLLQAKIFFKP